MATRKKVKILWNSFVAQMGLSLLTRTSTEGRHIFSTDYAREWCSNYKSRFIQIGDNEVHYQDEGEGPVLLMLHGFGGSLHVWNEWTKDFSKDHRVIRLDLPGFGLSSPLRGKVKIEYFTEFIHQFLDKIGVQECYLVGNSLGGWVSWEYCSTYPDRIKKMALLNSAGYFDRSGKPRGIELIAKDQFKKLLRSGAPKMLIKQLVKNSFGTAMKLPEEMVHRTYILANREGMLASFIYVASSAARSNIERIGTMKTPTLIMWGNQDKVINVENAARFHADIPESELIIYNKVGHLPMMEKATKSADDLRKFLQKDK